ncbi:MAG: hypothetical protein ACREDD_09790 [Methylocella sp.]
MAQLNGRWSYRSFRSVANGTLSPTVLPWAPPGELVATTDATGKITGKLTFAHGWVALTVTGSVTPAAEKEGLPEGIEVTGEGLMAVYKLRGYFLDHSGHVVGTVIAVRNDLGQQPDGTSGPFALFKISS